MGLREKVQDALATAEDLKERAGRGDAGRMLAILCTDLEKALAWCEYLNKHHGDEQEFMTFGDGGNLAGQAHDPGPPKPPPKNDPGVA
jgi:hypothetical protein